MYVGVIRHTRKKKLLKKYPTQITSHKPCPISDQNGQVYPLFQTNTDRKPYPLLPHIPHITPVLLISYSAKGLGTNLCLFTVFSCFHFPQDRGWRSWQLTLLTVLQSTGKKNFIRKCLKDIITI